MKKFNFIAAGVFVLLSICLIPMPVMTGMAYGSYTIDDSQFGANTYWGGILPVGHEQDVYFNQGWYGVDRMEVNRTAASLTAALTGPYFADDQSNDAAPIGDLFLSNNGWNPYGNDANNSLDTMLNGEDWEYVLAISDRTGNYLHPIQLSQLWDSELGYVDDGLKSTYTGDLNLYEVSEKGTITTASSRINQEYTYTPYDGQKSLGLGTWELSEGTLTFSLTGTDLGQYGLASDLGVHFTMECGNDVVEGRVGSVGSAGSVPEPATMLLLGTGLIGLAGIGRRKSFRK